MATRAWFASLQKSTSSLRLQADLLGLDRLAPHVPPRPECQLGGVGLVVFRDQLGQGVRRWRLIAAVAVQEKDPLEPGPQNAAGKPLDVLAIERWRDRNR